ncbi:hypothetical protein QCA50_002272 [Cerrena zonata]|uniref:Inositol-pentakisphosphate 2-kinase n=1 Tax=Cerrena zonata TaxID=2478898 RepID=A0AAW0GXN7_9APHY
MIQLYHGTRLKQSSISLSTTMDPHITETAPTDWKYISEGGSSIVFSYTGPPNPDFDETALRLRKVDHDSSLTDTPSFEEVEPDDPSIIFQHRIIERLFPSTFLPHLDAVKVDGPWLEKLSHLVEEHRPEERRERDKIDTRKHKAVLATDLVGGHGWAVEIKPKWGFLPNPTHLFPESKALKTRTCRFCMHSHLKSTEGEEVSLGYCPPRSILGRRRTRSEGPEFIMGCLDRELRICKQFQDLRRGAYASSINISFFPDAPGATSVSCEMLQSLHLILSETK